MTAAKSSRKLAGAAKDRIELQAPRKWVRKLDAAATTLGLSRSAYIRLSCNRQMSADAKGHQ
jgi:hypothetical protein